MSGRDEAARLARVGFLLAVAVGALAAGIWVIGNTSRVWSPKNRYLVRFNNVQGLSEGSIVSVAGFTIGTVRHLELPKNVQSGMVEITLALDRRHAHYIRQDTRARIKTIGLLGDKYIELSPGSPAAPELSAGAEITAVQPPNLDALMSQGESVADNLVRLTANLAKITDRWERGEGFFGALIADTEDGKRLSADIKAAMAALRSLGEKADRGEGVLATLLNDERPARELKAAIASLGRVATALESGPGFAARILNDPELGREAADNLTRASRELAELATRLNHGEGLVPRLTTDAELGREVAENLRETTANLASVTRRVAEGEGTLGKLLVDETLYRGLNDILAGASKSRLTRWFVARSQKRGAQDRIEAGAAATPAPRR